MDYDIYDVYVYPREKKEYIKTVRGVGYTLC